MAKTEITGLFKSLDGVDISNFAFLYQEFNSSPGLVCEMGFMKLCVKFNEEDSMVISYVFSIPRAAEFSHKFYNISEKFNVESIVVILDALVERYAKKVKD